MVAVKIPDAVRDDLRESNLVVWEARKDRVSKDHPWRFQVTLAGPGIDMQPHGFGDSLEDAIDYALGNAWFKAKLPGLVGAMARLEVAVQGLILHMALDDDVPF